MSDTPAYGLWSLAIINSLVFIIFAGFILLAKAWKVLYEAQRTHVIASTGPYARVRHPQYIGFVAILLGFLLQWPTLLTFAMFPILVLMYARLAVSEEREMLSQFGNTYAAYASRTPRFVPRLGARIAANPGRSR